MDLQGQKRLWNAGAGYDHIPDLVTQSLHREVAELWWWKEHEDMNCEQPRRFGEHLCVRGNFAESVDCSVDHDAIRVRLIGLRHIYEALNTMWESRLTEEFWRYLAQNMLR